MIAVWRRLHATWQSRGLLHTKKKIWKTSSKNTTFVAIWNLLKREDCNFTKHGRTQSSSTAHYQWFASRKWYAWRQRMRYTKRDAYSKSATSCTPTEFANRSTRWTITRCKKPSGSKSSWETRNNTVDYRIPGILVSAVEQQDKNRKDKVKKVDWEVWEPRILSSRLLTDEGDQQVQRDIAGADRRHE